MDSNDYPDEEELEKIRKWDSAHDALGLFEFIEDIWWNPGWGFHLEDHKLTLDTGGWSGNEDIISALMENNMFWTLWWKESRRGGHYIFDDSMVANELRWGHK